MNIEGQDIETYKTFVVSLDNNKFNFPMRSDSLTPNNNDKIVRDDLDDEEKTEYLESSSDKGGKQKRN